MFAFHPIIIVGAQNHIRGQRPACECRVYLRHSRSLAACRLHWTLAFHRITFLFLHEILVVRYYQSRRKMRTSSSFIKVHSIFSWYDYVATCVFIHIVYGVVLVYGLSYIELHSFHVTFIFQIFVRERIRDLLDIL